MILEKVPVPWYHENLVVTRINFKTIAKVKIPEGEEKELGYVSINDNPPVYVKKDEWRIDTSELVNKYFAYVYWVQGQFKNRRDSKRFVEFEKNIADRYAKAPMFSESQLFWRTVYGVLHNYSLAALADGDFANDWKELNDFCAQNAKAFHPHYLLEYA